LILSKNKAYLYMLGTYSFRRSISATIELPTDTMLSKFCPHALFSERNSLIFAKT